MPSMPQKRFLNEQLECPTCGKITLDIPDDATENTPISCSQCGTVLGTWGDLQDSFHRQQGKGVFDVKGGRFERK